MLQLLEHQGKAILRDAGLAVPRGVLLGPDDPIGAVRESIGAPPWMVKAQVRGHRRAGWGGVVRVGTEGELEAVRSEMFRRRVRPFERVLVEEHRPIDQEWFCAALVETGTASLRLLIAPTGGAEVDAALSQGRFGSLRCDPESLPDATTISNELGPLDARIAGAAERLCQVAVERDCLLVEANPLGIAADGVLVVLDAHVSADPSAGFRQAWLAAYADEIARLDPDVAWRRRWDGDLFVIDPQGEVATINTGAGSGLFLVDELARRGLRPMNFSDVRMVGMIRQPERMEAVVERILSSSSARTVLVNIHAGIGDPLEYAHLVLAGARSLRDAGRTVVIRLAGRNADAAGQQLQADGFTVRVSLRDALDDVETAVRGARA